MTREQPTSPTALTQVESLAKPIVSVLGCTTAVCAFLLAVVGIFSDIYKFFLTLLVVWVLSIGAVAVLWRCRTRSSQLAGAEKIKVARYGTGIVWFTFAICLACGLGIVVLLAFFSGTIFDPVVTARNDSAITIAHTVVADTLVRIGVAKPVFDGKEVPLSLPDGPLFAALQDWRAIDAESPVPKFTLTFDITLKDRFDWVKVEKVSVEVLSFMPIPKGVKFVYEEMEARLRPALAFKTTISGVDPPMCPFESIAVLSSTGNNVTSRGSLVIDDHKPTSVYIDVHVETDGIYVLAPVIVVNAGWKSRAVRPLKPIAIYSEKRTRSSLERPPIVPPGVPLPAPKFDGK